MVSVYIKKVDSQATDRNTSILITLSETYFKWNSIVFGQFFVKNKLNPKIDIMLRFLFAYKAFLWSKCCVFMHLSNVWLSTQNFLAIVKNKLCKSIWKISLRMYFERNHFFVKCISYWCLIFVLFYYIWEFSSSKAPLQLNICPINVVLMHI